ncbi:hypothetical protein NDU88_003664 [Pleurodeles waltl]|uniref:Uncharacterized protein n=1 Tax=Pleurodeles waltl TaxID=8319 RepID=A0AAV7WSA3_PLEWA|nr:hypothetical protein NDU88_003664 [Pleurodeles waltl]
MGLASVDQGCDAGRDGALCTSRAVSTGHGAGSGIGVSAEHRHQEYQGCSVSKMMQNAGPTGHGSSSSSVMTMGGSFGETRDVVRRGARLGAAESGHGSCSGIVDGNVVVFRLLQHKHTVPSTVGR